MTNPTPATEYCASYWCYHGFPSRIAATNWTKWTEPKPVRKCRNRRKRKAVRRGK